MRSNYQLAKNYISMIDILRQATLFARLRWRFNHWSNTQIQDHQQRRLRKLFDVLRRQSPFYATQFDPAGRIDLELLDTMNKAGLMEHFDQLNTAGLKRDELISFKVDQERKGAADLFQGKYSIGLSSGTSGNQVLTVLSARERRDYGPLIMARTNLPRIGQQYRVLFALRVNNPAFMEINNRKLFLTHVNYTHDPEYLIRIINEKQLNILAGPPSLLRLLAPLSKQLNQPVRGIISYAEVLSPATSQLLNNSFKAPVLQIYQGAEGFLAGTCSAGALHLNEDTTKVELFDVAGTESNIKRVVITDLYRTTLPFIRYELNDLIEIDPEPCSCGSNFRKIKQIHGRADDLFELESQKGELKYLFPDYIRRSIIQASPAVIEYQAIQKSKSQIEIRLVIKSNHNQSVIQAQILKNLDHWIGRIGAKMPQINFSKALPEVHQRSKKMIRIMKAF